jgi:NADH-quinone oxidoreductase subunit C
LSRAAELAAALDAGGCTTDAPTTHPLLGVAESRWIAPASLVAAAQEAQRAGFFFESMTCIDRLDAAGPGGGAFELLYTFNRYDELGRVAFRVWAPRGAVLPSLAGVFGIAGWNEREAWEFFGVEFAGHPDLTWLLLPEGTAFRPLLKSFTAPPPSEYDDSLNRASDAAAREPEPSHR